MGGGQDSCQVEQRASTSEAEKPMYTDGKENISLLGRYAASDAQGALCSDCGAEAVHEIAGTARAVSKDLIAIMRVR